MSTKLVFCVELSGEDLAFQEEMVSRLVVTFCKITELLEETGLHVFSSSRVIKEEGSTLAEVAEELATGKF